MRIVFLQISDLHIKDKSGAHPSRIQAIVQSIHEFDEFDGIVIVLSGDLAATGSKNEYSIVSSFIGQLMSGIRTAYPNIDTKNIKLLVVPGNHDIHYSTGHRPDSSLVENAFKNRPEEYLISELDNMQNFMAFANASNCFFIQTSIPNGRIYTRKILHFSNGYMVEANLLNTAPFSCENDDGLHYIPDEVITSFNNPSRANISITVMHHSPDWFNFAQRKSLQDVIARRCCISFFGHEHIHAAQQIFSEGVDRTIYQGCGAWWQKAAPDKCEFYASILDTDKYMYSVFQMSWNGRQFDSSSAGNYPLMHKPLNGVSLPCTDEYLKEIRSDCKHPVSNSIEDYYVFLKLRINDPNRILEEKNINTLEELLSFIHARHYVAILGGSNSGKTTLLKILFSALFTDYTVLYCGTDDITGRNSEKIIRELVEETYGEQSYSAFKTIPSESKIILIDDLHRIVPKHIKKFLNEIKQQFGTIVFASDNSDQLDIVQNLRESIQVEEEFYQLYISRLYASKRYELITKIVNIKGEHDSISNESLSRTLEQCLNTYKMAFNTDIDFVVQFVDYYCSHFNELDNSDTTVFSKVFESSIETTIAVNLSGRKENANDIIVALSEVAFYLHFNMEYPISIEHIKKSIEYYCEYYDNNYLTTSRFVEIAVNSGLLILSPSGDSYRFKSKDHLAYFVAKALNRKFHDDRNDKYLRQIVDQSCFGINGDILLFLTYIGENVAIVRLLLEQEYALVKDWPEFDVANISAKYLTSTQTAELSAPSADQRERNLETRSSIEEVLDQDADLIQTIDLYDYDISQIDEFNNQIIRAFLGLKTISRSLSAFFSILPSPDKKKTVNAIFKLPNLIFGRITQEIDIKAKELIEDLVSNQDPQAKKQLTKADVLNMLQMLSTQSLLSLYLTAAQYGVNPATVDYLVNQDIIIDSTNYQFERLFFYDKVDDWSALITNAEKLFENDNGILRTLCLLCLRHMLVYSRGLPRKDRLKISSKYFPKTSSYLLVSRQKALPSKKV